MNISENFIKYLYNLSKNPLSAKLVKDVRRCFLDYLGVTLAGAKLLGSRGENLIKFLGEGDGSYIIGFNKKGSIQTAAFINGFSSHSAELDDGVISGIIHPGAPVFSSLFSVAEKYNSSFEHFIEGSFIGYEASVRLANAIQPSHKKLGYHATGTCGMIGAALGVGILLNQDEKKLKNTLSTAIAAAHGSLKVLEDNSELKPYNVASSSCDAIMAAMVAESGFEGANDPLNGYAGFLSQFAGDDYDLQKLFKTPEQTYAIEDVYVKPYAACRYCHPSIENALLLRNNINDPNDIDYIKVRTYELAVNKHDMTSVENVSAAKMSIPFAIAVSLVHGSANIGDYTLEAVQNNTIKNIMKKIQVTPDQQFSQEFPKKSIASLEIKLKNGKILNSKIDYPKGEANFPLTDDELIIKFISLALYSGLSKKKAESIVNEILFKNFIIKDIISLLS